MKKLRAAALLLAVFLLAVLASSLAGCTAEKERYQKVYLDAFDTAITIVGYADSEEAFAEMAEYVHGELIRYHRLYDIYTKYGTLNNLKTVNENAGAAPVAVDEDIMDLLEFSLKAYDISGGRVNIAMGSVLSIWHDYRNTGINYPDRAKVPTREELLAADEHSDISNMVLDRKNGTVFLADPDMSLDVGAVAKGYATEKIAQDLIAKGYDNIVLNVGGNVRAIGAKADKNAWVVGIQNPDLSSDTTHIETIEIEGLSLATSGVYQRYYVADGKNYHHIIDGETLMPENRYLSVSVLTEDAGLADALSTALFNMDFETGSAFAEEFSKGGEAGVFEVMWVLPDGSKRYSDGFEKYIAE